MQLLQLCMKKLEGTQWLCFADFILILLEKKQLKQSAVLDRVLDDLVNKLLALKSAALTSEIYIKNHQLQRHMETDRWRRLAQIDNLTEHLQAIGLTEALIAHINLCSVQLLTCANFKMRGLLLEHVVSRVKKILESAFKQRKEIHTLLGKISDDTLSILLHRKALAAYMNQLTLGLGAPQLQQSIQLFSGTRIGHNFYQTHEAVLQRLLLHPFSPNLSKFCKQAGSFFSKEELSGTETDEQVIYIHKDKEYLRFINNVHRKLSGYQVTLDPDFIKSQPTRAFVISYLRCMRIMRGSYEDAVRNRNVFQQAVALCNATKATQFSILFYCKSILEDLNDTFKEGTQSADQWKKRWSFCSKTLRLDSEIVAEQKVSKILTLFVNQCKKGVNSAYIALMKACTSNMLVYKGKKGKQSYQSSSLNALLTWFRKLGLGFSLEELGNPPQVSKQMRPLCHQAYMFLIDAESSPFKAKAKKKRKRKKRLHKGKGGSLAPVAGASDP